MTEQVIEQIYDCPECGLDICIIGGWRFHGHPEPDDEHFYCSWNDLTLVSTDGVFVWDTFEL